MIQRIQTLYLLAATILMAVTLFAPLMSVGTEEGVTILYSYKLVDPQGVVIFSPWHLAVLVALTALLPFGIIFRYKHRLAQIRFCIVEMVLLVGMMVMAGFYCYRLYSLTSGASEIFSTTFHVTLLCPVVALLASWLASRAIFRDELLVRAADRIR